MRADVNDMSCMSSSLQTDPGKVNPGSLIHLLQVVLYFLEQRCLSVLPYIVNFAGNCCFFRCLLQRLLTTVLMFLQDSASESNFITRPTSVFSENQVPLLRIRPISMSFSENRLPCTTLTFLFLFPASLVLKVSAPLKRFL